MDLLVVVLELCNVAVVIVLPVVAVALGVLVRLLRGNADGLGLVVGEGVIHGFLPFLFTKSTLVGSGVDLDVGKFVKPILPGKVVKLLVPGLRPYS